MTRFHRSLRFRLTCWYSAVLAFVLAGFGALLYGAVRYQNLHHHDDSLRAAAQAVTAILSRQPDCATLTADQVEDLGRLDRLVLVHELAGQGRVFYRSPALDPALPPRSEEEFRGLLSQAESFQTLERPHGALRIYSVRYATLSGRQGVIRVMDSLGNVEEALATLRWSLLLMVPLSLVVAAAGGYWLAGRSLRPVDEVTRLAREIEATNLSRRLPAPATDDEMGRLVGTFNQMIGRLEASFESMRQFTADASHELRTPLAIMRNTIDVTLGRERAAAAYRQVLADLLEQVERLSRLVEGLLFLARADGAGLAVDRTDVRLDEIAFEIVETMRPLAEAEGIKLRGERLEPVKLAGDGKWLRQMLFNLVDNAIKHNREAGSVWVSLETHGGSAILSVHDTGHGIPEEEQPRLFERFYRLDKSRSRKDGGAGLGLSIAMWIARSHGGDIRVQSRLGEGNTFSVTLPGQTPPDDSECVPASSQPSQSAAPRPWPARSAGSS